MLELVIPANPELGGVIPLSTDNEVEPIVVTPPKDGGYDPNDPIWGGGGGSGGGGGGGGSGGGGDTTPVNLEDLKRKAADALDSLFNKAPYSDLDGDGDVDATDAAEYHRVKMVEEGYYTPHTAAYLQISEMADDIDKVQKDGKYRPGGTLGGT